jgi:hypothetical protein
MEEGGTMSSDELGDRVAQWGERMIEVRVRFWTDKIADGRGQIRPRHAWAAGVVLMDRNEAHGINPREPVPFNSLAELPVKIERALMEHEVKIHHSSRERKYRVG